MISKLTCYNNNNNNNNNNKKSLKKRMTRWEKLDDDMWLEIMRRVSIKSLYSYKCVSKSWLHYAGQVLNRKRGLELPTMGLVFILEPPPPVVAIGFISWRMVSGFISFNDMKTTKWSCEQISSIREGSGACIYKSYRYVSVPKICSDIGDTTIECKAMVEVDDYDVENNGGGLLLGNLKLNFDGINDCGYFRHWSMHRGLLLTVPDGITCHVYNPATREAMVLPTSPLQKELAASKNVFFSPKIEKMAAIINLSDSFCADARCRFMVVRVSKQRSFVEVYYSDKHEWVLSEYRLSNPVLAATWLLDKCVFLEDTLFVQTDVPYVVAVKFPCSKQAQAYVHCLCLPRSFSAEYFRSVLGVYQGCLYVAYGLCSDIRFWKHNGSSSTDADAWIPQLKFAESVSPERPPLTKNLRFILGEKMISPIVFLPDRLVLIIYAHPFLFAVDLLNDTVEKIDGWGKRGRKLDRALTYTPCFASLGSIKVPNQA